MASLGSIEIALRHPVISAAELEREVRRLLGDGWDRGPQATPEPPLPLSRTSVVVPTKFAGRPNCRAASRDWGSFAHVHRPHESLQRQQPKTPPRPAVQQPRMWLR
jgi:hypothetical protein